MKKLIAIALLVSIAAFSYIKLFTLDSRLTGTWNLEVFDPDGKRTATLIVAFSDEDAETCSVAGKWKLVRIISASSEENTFFPEPTLGILLQELSYQLDGDTLEIGMNTVCDYGKRLTGELINSQSTGEYVEWSGWGHYESLGSFKIMRIDS